MNVSLLFPELLLLLVPLLYVLFRWRSSGIGTVVRVLVAVTIALLAAVPLAPLGGRGVDVVIVADLSRSMPADSRARMLEIISLVEKGRAEGDRVGVVTYGREARLERLPQELGELSVFVQEVDPDGSDLGGAISLAASLVPPERPGRLIVMSDGEATGSPMSASAQEAAARGLPIDFRAFTRGEAADVAVESLDVPGTVDEREPFQFSARVRTNRTVEAEAILLRDGVEIARGSRTFQPGSTPLTFRDVIDQPGVSRYRLELSTDTRDRVPENNVGEAAVRVEAPATILLVNASGRPDNFSRALQSGKLRVDVVAPAALPRDLAKLVAYRAVILENVSASSIGPAGLTVLSQFATDLGGGLMLTGGQGSFGVGGYFKSALEPHLPVSMEIKNEHRKLSLAMVVALDRSGSMAAPVGDGRTKMDLANLGTCAAIDTLGPFDEVGVVAVDSAPHVVSPLTSAEEKDAVCDKVRTIQSLGGGIFTYTALVTAATMVQESSKGTRHIVLFADAADAEEPGEYERLLATIRPLGISVSVIGLGQETDSDAEFLKDVAARGGGRVQFTRNVEELPRLFAQEAITVARSSFIADVTAVRALPDMVLLGDLPVSPLPGVDGYNLTYLRPGATMGVVTADEYEAPVLAFWHRGLGRVASLTAEVDGEYSQRLNAWRGFSAFAVGVGRWLLGGEPPTGVQATMERESGQGIVRVDLDPDRLRGGANDVRAATAMIVVPSERGGSDSRRLNLSWTSEDALEARFPIERAGTYFGAVRLGTGSVLPLAPLSLPYSPEYEPRIDPNEGRAALAEMARVTGGVERTAWEGLFSASRLRDRQVRDLVLPLALLLLLLQMLEIAGRRLLVFDAAGAWLRSVRLPRVFGRRSHDTTVTPSPDVAVDRWSNPTQPANTANEPAAASRPAESPLARAKARARDRMGG